MSCTYVPAFVLLDSLLSRYSVVPTGVGVHPRVVGYNTFLPSEKILGTILAKILPKIKMGKIIAAKFLVS